MTNPVLRFVALVVAATLLTACSRNDAASKASRTATANGTLASPSDSATVSNPTAVSTPAPSDSITDRADRGRILGDSKAAVWVVMVSDFQCPYCKQWHDAAFQQIMKTYVNTGRVHLAFVNMPLSIHPNAVPAAEAAMCASVQDKFWPLHEALFATQKQWEHLPNAVPMFDSLAKSLKVNMDPWHQCMTQHSVRSLIQADHDRAYASHINSTPAFFVGDQALAGADADIPAAIEAALAKAKGAKKPGT
ncbi:MAG: thioredoxin domain-containing protein [bacterium]